MTALLERIDVLFKINSTKFALSKLEGKTIYGYTIIHIMWCCVYVHHQLTQHTKNFSSQPFHDHQVILPYYGIQLDHKLLHHMIACNTYKTGFRVLLFLSIILLVDVDLYMYPV